MFKFVLLIAVLIAVFHKGAACDNPCTQCFTDLGPFKCSMLGEVRSCLGNDANCDLLSYTIYRLCFLFPTTLSYGGPLILDLTGSLLHNKRSTGKTVLFTQAALMGYYHTFYRTSSGIGVDVYNSYMGIGDRSTWNLPDNCLVECGVFFRGDLMDLWEYLPINTVDFIIEDQEGGTSQLRFDGRNSTKTNWFSFERLVSSPWDDLTKDNSYFFSIEGFAGVRRFYIAKKHSACYSEYGWLSIVEGQKWCNYAKADSYPKILFSGLAGATLWNKEYKDAAQISVKIKLDE